MVSHHSYKHHYSISQLLRRKKLHWMPSNCAIMIIKFNLLAQCAAYFTVHMTINSWVKEACIISCSVHVMLTIWQYTFGPGKYFRDWNQPLATLLYTRQSCTDYKKLHDTPLNTRGGIVIWYTKVYSCTLKNQDWQMTKWLSGRSSCLLLARSLWPFKLNTILRRHLNTDWLCWLQLNVTHLLTISNDNLKIQKSQLMCSDQQSKFFPL